MIIAQRPFVKRHTILSSATYKLFGASLVSCALFFSSQTTAQQLTPELLENLSPGTIDQFSSQINAVKRPKDTFVAPKIQKAEPPKATEKPENNLFIPKDYSAIEENYAARMGVDTKDPEAKPLEQYGYDGLAKQQVVRGSTYDGGATGGAVGQDYILGAGDQLTISFRGQEATTEYVTVTNGGQVILSTFEPIAAGGLSVRDFEQRLNDLVQESYGDTDVFVSLTTVRQRQVMVLGEVDNPGSQRLSAFATVMDALAASGGIKKSGSLRQVLIMRGGRKIPVDLYTILMGNVSGGDKSLQDGDRIVVPGIGRTIAITGDVARPGIYELAPGQISIAARRALSYAGNAILPQDSQLLVTDVARGGATLKEITSNSTVNQGSILQVQQGSRLVRSDVTIERGADAFEQRAIADGASLKSVLRGLEYLPANTYLPFAAIVGRQQTASVNLYNVFNGEADYTLKSGDKIVLLSHDDVRYLWSADVQDILKNKVLTRLELPDGVGNMSENASNKQALFVNRQQKDQFGNTPPVTTAKACAGLSNLMHIVQTEGDRRFSNVQRSLDSNQLFAVEDEETHTSQYRACPDVFKRHGDLLPLLLDNSVSLLGALQVPGAYPVADSVPLQEILRVAGGVSRDADRQNIYLNRRTFGKGSQTEQRIAVALNTLDATVQIKAGDSVVIRREPNKASVGTIRLAGQFERPGIYEIRDNETLTSVIERAGGLTDLAYAYGAIFSRKNIQKAEKAGYERVAQQMESALISNLGNIQASGQNPTLILAGINQMVEKFRNAKAVGRMVIEADPNQLYSNPQLDILLEDGDYLHIPKRPSYVMVSGHALNPGALQFASNMAAEDYLKQAGGLQKSADKKRAFVILPNGQAQPLKLAFWNYKETKIPPGSTIVIPAKPVQIGFFQLLTNIGGVTSQLAVSAASLSVIGRD